MLLFKKRILIPGLLALIVFSYLNTLYSPPVLDDATSFINEGLLYGNTISLESIQKLASTRFGWARLIPLASFALDHSLGQGSIVQFHITNIVIHLLATMACFVFLHLLWGQKNYSPIENNRDRRLLMVFFAVTVWALNPVQTNAVTYIVQRMTSLAALFYLLSLCGYIVARTSTQPGRKFFAWPLFIIMACASFLSKENSATLPVAVLLIEELFIQPGLIGRVLRSRLFIRLLPLLLIFFVVLLPVLSVFWEKWIAAHYSIRHFSMEQRLLTELRVVVFYISLFLLPLPSRMNLDHDFSLSHSLFTPFTTLLSFVVLLAIIVLAVRVRHTNRLLSFGILWFFLHLIIESTVVPLELVFEHRLYLPSVGIVIVLASVLETFISRIKSADQHRFLFLLTLIVASVLSLLTSVRNYAWRDTVSIYHDCLQKSPLKARTHSNYALALGQMKKYREALLESEKAIELGREYYEEDVASLANIVVCYNRLGEYDKAIARANDYLLGGLARKNMRSFPLLMNNLGISFFKTADYRQCYNAFLTGLQLAPHDQHLISGMAFLLNFASKDEEAGKALEFTGVKGEQFIRLARVMMDIRRYDLAEGYLLKAEEAGVSGLDLADVRQQLQELVRKNNQAVQAYILENDSLYSSSLKGRALLRSVQFILQYYPPLQGKVVRLLLDLADEYEKDNPHVLLYRARSYSASGEIEMASLVLAKLTDLYKDFPAALYEQGMLARKRGDAMLARKSLQKLLSIYPAHPSWYRIENIIAQ
jgi:tetratricopeptide (TPR) repeat protein